MRLDKLALGLMGIMVLVIVVAILEQRSTNEQLRNQIEGLSQKAGQGAPASPRNQSDPIEIPRAADRTELTGMRAEINQLKNRTQDLAQAISRGPSGSTPLNLMPASGWKNAGKDTPSAAAESFMWAAGSGDLNVLANSIVLDPSAREKANEILARMPQATRDEYNTPEKLIALFLAREGDARAMQILGESTAGDDALVNLRLQKDDGKTKEEGYQFRRTGDGWRLVVPGKAVDKFGKKLTEPPKK